MKSTSTKEFIFVHILHNIDSMLEVKTFQKEHNWLT